MKTQMFRWVLGGLMLIVLGVLVPQEASAQSAGDKFVRGCVNTASGIVEIPGNIYDTKLKQGTAQGYTLGLMKGFAMMPVRTIVGLFEVLTFPISAPRHYSPIMNPATPYDYWNQRPVQLQVMPAQPQQQQYQQQYQLYQQQQQQYQQQYPSKPMPKVP